MLSKSDVKILDTTLRDGSYAVGFQFTPEDTAIICAALDQIGIEFIEIGHGLGLDAGNRISSKSAASDEEYLQAASESVKKAEWGVFFIPGIGAFDSIRRAADYGMDFIRVGVNVTEPEASEKYVGEAKKRGLDVSVNLMKSYVVSASEFTEAARRIESFGADSVFLVDSAGGMLPDEVKQYICSAKNSISIPIGFHGHNNLGMACANALEAVKAGATVIDSSLRGIGRSSGNAVTEIMSLLLIRLGMHLPMDISSIMNLSEKYIDPIMKKQLNVDSLGIMSGYAKFHSSFLNFITQSALKHNVDSRKLIVEVSRREKIDVTESLVDMLATGLPKYRKNAARLNISRFQVSEKNVISPVAKVLKVAESASIISIKYGLSAVFNIVQPYCEKKSNVSDLIYKGEQFVYASAEISSPSDAKNICRLIDSRFPLVLLDCDHRNADSRKIVASCLRNIKNSAVMRYSDMYVLNKSVLSTLCELRNNTAETNFFIFGDTAPAMQCRQMIVDMMGNCPIISGISEEIEAKMTRQKKIILLFKKISDRMVIALRKDDIVVDVVLGQIPKHLVSALSKKGIMILRPNMRDHIFSEIQSLYSIKTNVAKNFGIRNFRGVRMASGGILAPQDTVIVDSISEPSHIYGVSDGLGFIIPRHLMTEKQKSLLKKIKSAILNSLL
jgi:4-hydroxy-2-oxovalerate aldolase